MRSPGIAASFGFLLIFAFAIAMSFVEFRPPLMLGQPDVTLPRVLKR